MIVNEIKILEQSEYTSDDNLPLPLILIDWSPLTDDQSQQLFAVGGVASFRS